MGGGAGCCVRAFLFPDNHTVYHNYSKAGWCWVHGEDAYAIERDAAGRVIPHMSGYRYSPLVSMLLVPFSLFPDAVGGVLFGRVGGWLAYRLVGRYESSKSDPDKGMKFPLMRRRAEAPFN